MRAGADKLARKCGDEGASNVLVVPRLSAFGEDHLAEQLRPYLEIAKVIRPALHRTTRTQVKEAFARAAAAVQAPSTLSSAADLSKRNR